MIARKPCPRGKNVTRKVVADMILTEEISPTVMSKVYSVMTDTTSLNTGCVQGTNVRIQRNIQAEFVHGVPPARMLDAYRRASTKEPPSKESQRVRQLTKLMQCITKSHRLVSLILTHYDPLKKRQG